MTQGSIFDPVTGFIFVWMIAGSVIAFAFNLAGYKSMKAVGLAYAFSLLPAFFVSLILSS